MLPVYFLVLFWPILDRAPKAAAQNKGYKTFFHYTDSLSNAKPRFHVIATGDGNINIFRPYSNSQQIGEVTVTDDFHDYSKTIQNVAHLAERRVLSMFTVFDRNTSGLASDYVMGVTDYVDDGKNKLVAVLSDSDTTKEYCTDCIDANLTGYTSTSWDPVRNRWVSLANPPAGDCFATSPDLMHWTYRDWNVIHSAIGPYENILEMFPITDEDDPSKTVWVLIRNSEPDADGLRTLLWDTFAPDDNDQQYKQMGVLDASPYVNEFAIVNDDSTDYRSRRVVFTQRADYRDNGIYYNTFVIGRVLTYKGGSLRQMPIGTVFGPPTFERTFPTIDYRVGDSVLSCLRRTVVFKIEVDLEIVDNGSNFTLFLNPEADGEFAAGFSIRGSDQNVVLFRGSKWFAPNGSNPPRDAYGRLVNPFREPTNGYVDVLLLVDVGVVEYFVLNGLYTGTIVAFPDLTWRHHEFTSEVNTTIRNLAFTAYDTQQ